MYFNNSSGSNRFNNSNNNRNNYQNNMYNNYNNQQNNNQKSPDHNEPNITGTFLIVLLVFTAIVMAGNVINVMESNKKMNEETSEKDKSSDNKKENNDSLIIDVPTDGQDKNENNDKKPELSVEEKNKEELINLCKKVDANGMYKYDEYVKYIDSFDATDMSEKEMYEIMSKKTYCHNNSCVKIEKEGIINYVVCDTGSYSRISFDEYEVLQQEQSKINQALTKACSSVDNNGNFDSGAATGIRVTCTKFICSVDYNDEIITKNCK